MFFWKKDDASKPRPKRIGAKEAKEMIDAGGVVIVDARTPGEFSEKRIPGAINIPCGNIAGTRPKELPDLDATILVYCLSGGRSALAVKHLAAMGYTKLYDFGGIMSWPYDTTC